MCEYGGRHGLLLLACHARWGGILQLLKLSYGGTNIAEKHIGHVAAEALAHHDTHHYAVFDVLGHGVGGYHPSALLEFILQVEEGPLGILGILLLHVPDEERVHDVGTIVSEGGHLANLCVQVAGYLHRVLLHLTVAFESEADKLVVLSQYLCSGAREVESYLCDVSTEIVYRERHLAG